MPEIIEAGSIQLDKQVPPQIVEAGSITLDAPPIKRADVFDNKTMLISPSKQPVAAVEAKQGPMATDEPNPPRFGFDDIMDGIATPSERPKTEVKSSVVSAFDYAVKPWLQVGFSGGESFNRGMATFATHLDTIAEYFEEKTGMERGKLFERAAVTYNENADYWKKRAEDVGTSFLTELLGEATGGALPGIAEFMLNVPYAALLGASEANKNGGNEIGSALTDAAKRYSLGKIFEMMNPLKQYLRAPAMGAVFAGQTATEGGTPRDIAKAFGTGAIYSAMSPGGRYGLNELKNNARSYFEKDMERAAEIKSTAEKAEANAPEDTTATTQEAQIKAEAEKFGLEVTGIKETPGEPVMVEYADLKTGLTFEAEEGVHLPSVLGKLDKKATENILPDAMAEGKLVYRQGNENGQWWSFDKNYAETFGKKGKKVTSRRLPDNIKLIDEVELSKELLPSETIDQALNRLGYDGMIRLEGQMTGPDTTSVYLKSPLPGSTPPTSDMFSGEAAFAPQADFRRMPEGAPIEGEKPMGRSDIKKFLEDNLLVPIRTGRFRSPGAMGIFKLKEEVIRTKFANDIETIAHEIGHALQKFLWPDSIKSNLGAKGMSETPFGPYTSELDPMATQARAGQPPSTEGFAEFVRLYITDNAKAQRLAPGFHSYFESVLGEKSPETKAIFEEARKRYDVFMQQPALQRVVSQISIGTKESKALSVDDLYAKWLDDLHPLENVVKEMAQGRELPMSKDPYKLARLMKGWAGKAEAFLKHAPFKFGTYEDIPNAKPLKEILDPARDNLDEFRAYIVSKRALELADRGIETGILRKDAAAVVAENEAKYAPVFEELKQFQDHTLDYLRDSGLLSRDGYKKMKAANQAYVPFYRVMEDQKNSGTGTGLESRQPTKTIKGSWRDIVDPLESIVKNTHLFIQLAEKNAVGTALVDLSKSGEGLGKYVEKIPMPLQKVSIKEVELLSILQRFGKWTETTQYKETKNTIGEKITSVGTDGEALQGGSRAGELMEKQALEALMHRGRTESEARIILEKIKKAPALEVKTKIIEKTIEKIAVSQTVKEFGLDIPEGVVDIFRPSAFVPKDGVVSVWKNGDQHLYQVPTELSRAYQALDKESMHTLFKILAYPASWLRAGSTLTPEFIGRNPIRDQWAAYINTKYGFVPGFDFLRGVFHMAAKDQVYWDFKKGGGDHSMLVSMDRDYLQDSLGDVLSKYPLSRVVKNPIDALRMLSELGEMGTRLGEFSRGIAVEGTSKGGMQKAALAAREVTLDFNRSGTAVRGAVNAIYAFSNAQLQDMNKIYRQFKEDPINTSIKVAVAITLPSVLLAAVNHDDPRYKDIPQWQKDLFWVVIPNRITQLEWDKMSFEERAQQSSWITGSIWRIPKPFTLGIMFGSVPERAVNYLMNQDPHAFDGMLSTLYRGVGMNMLPTAFIPITENWANKSMFFDRSIVPRGLENVMPEYQYGEYTSDTAKELGKLIGRLPQIGETGAASPAYIENLVRGWSGGLGKYALDIVGAGLRATGISETGSEKPSSTGSDMPLLKAFTVRYPSANTASIETFYENFQKADTANATVKHLIQEGQSESAIRIWEESGMQDLTNVQKALSNIRKVIKWIEQSPDMTADEKREQVDILYLQMTEMAGMGNKLYDQMKKEAKAQ